MIVSWLSFIAVGLITYAGFVKIAARLLRYSVSWRSSFFFAVMMLVLVILDHVLAGDQPVAIRIGHVVVLLLGLLALGSWFFSKPGTNPRRYSSWVARRPTTDGVDVCHDACCGVDNRSSRSGFSHEVA
jgi:hypothetical protein